MKKLAAHIELGKNGEDAVSIYLIKAGYGILERNWRHGAHEIDIIAEDYGMIVFVEVKTRREGSALSGLEMVRPAKQMFISEAARAYMSQHRLRLPFRFDVVLAEGNEAPFKITHLIDAFDFAPTPHAIRSRKDPLAL